MRLPLRGKPFLIRLLVLGCVAFFFGRGVGVVSAETIHQVRLHQGARVIVWEPSQPRREGTVVPLAAAEGPSGLHLAGGGQLVAASETAGTGPGARRFRVATNTPFSVRVRHGTDLFPGETPVALAITDVGPNATVPPGWTGFQSVAGISDAMSGSTLFRMPERTARRRGTPLSQSIEFAVIWPADRPNGAQIVIEAAR